MFEHIAKYPGDPILSLMEDFRDDDRDHKVNLSVGFYYDAQGNIPILESVKMAKAFIDSKAQQTNTYLPMEGDHAYLTAVEEYLFEGTNSEARAATVQSVGGSGALKVGADFLKRHYPDSQVWVSEPTWDNHIAIFQEAGFTVNRYPYLSHDGHLDFDALTKKLVGLPACSIILLHACCHNPTGIDLTPSQWDTVIGICAEKSLIPFLDAAYLGMGNGFNHDVYAIRKLASSGISGLVSNSFSKVFSLYGERVGSLSVLCESRKIRDNVASQLKYTIRSNYSTPPRHGANLVKTILSNPEINRLWRSEVETMRLRMQSMRSKLHQHMLSLNENINANYLLEQTGMFSFTGLNAEAVDRIRQKHGVYLIRNGRLCIAGLNEGNVSMVAQALTSEQ